MQHVIIVIHLMLVLAMIGVVLLQRSEGGGLGIGSTGGFMTSRGTANVLTRATAILAGLFFLTSLLLSILAGVGHKPTATGPSTSHGKGQAKGHNKTHGPPAGKSHGQGNGNGNGHDKSQNDHGQGHGQENGHSNNPGSGGNGKGKGH